MAWSRLCNATNNFLLFRGIRIHFYQIAYLFSIISRKESKPQLSLFVWKILQLILEIFK